MDFLIQGLGLALAPSVIILAAGFVAKSLIEHARDRDLANRKADGLKEQELFRKKLEAEAFEHQKTQSHLLQKRADVIDMLHSRIVEMSNTVGQMVNPLQLGSKDPEENDNSKTKRRSAAADAFNSFNEYFMKHDIYLPKELDSEVSALRDLVRQSFFDFDWSQGAYGAGENSNKWIEAYDRMTKEVPPVLENLKSEFRKLLGVKSEAN